MTRREVLSSPNRQLARPADKRLVGGSPLFARLRERAVAAALSRGASVVMGDAGASACQLELACSTASVSFGERLENTFADVRSLGYGEVSSDGAASPGLDTEHLADAFTALGSRDSVFGATGTSSDPKHSGFGGRLRATELG